jgi:transposase
VESTPPAAKEDAVELMYKRCAGLDVHQKNVVACVRIVDDGKVTEEVRTFETTTKGLLELATWLESAGCTHVAMEATGVYWKPVWHVLEPTFELVLANAAHIKNVPGRKTDVADAVWIADLLAHGLIRGSFVPPTPIQDLRALMRTRKQLVREAARNTQRIQKALEDANIKLTSVISDILGKSGRAVLNAMVEGETDPEKLVALTSRRLKAPREVLVEALRGNVREQHRFLIKLHLGQVDALNKAIGELDERVEAHLDPFRTNVVVLTTMPGISDTAANVLVSEIGHDMVRFPTAGHLRSWAGFCPRADQSAGKRRSSRIRHGAPWLKATLVQCAWAAIKTKDSYLRSQFYRLRSRVGPMKAIVAVAASMLTAAYHMLKNGSEYKDLGGSYLDRRDQAKLAKRLVRRLEALGLKVSVEQQAA